MQSDRHHHGELDASSFSAEHLCLGLDLPGMGSIAMEKVGNLPLDYSVSSSSLHPAIRYTGRASEDPSNLLGIETTLVEGTGSQTRTLNRWGHYSRLSIDPTDDCTFWYTLVYG
jgi:hypothetical protein